MSDLNVGKTYTELQARISYINKCFYSNLCKIGHADWLFSCRNPLHFLDLRSNEVSPYAAL